MSCNFQLNLVNRVDSTTNWPLDWFFHKRVKWHLTAVANVSGMASVVAKTRKLKTANTLDRQRDWTRTTPRSWGNGARIWSEKTWPWTLAATESKWVWHWSASGLWLWLSGFPNKIIDLIREASKAKAILYRCPSCFANFMQVLCEFTCSPIQSTFIDVIETKTNPTTNRKRHKSCSNDLISSSLLDRKHDHGNQYPHHGEVHSGHFRLVHQRAVSLFGATWLGLDVRRVGSLEVLAKAMVQVYGRRPSGFRSIPN